MKHTATLSLATALLAALPAAADQLDPRAATSKCTRIAPVPAGCGKKGTAASNRFLMASQTLDLATCAQFCAEASDRILDVNYGLSDMPCLTVSHDSASNLCTFFRGSPSAIGIQANPGSTTSFYDLQDCFNCTSKNCAVSPGTNIINNPNFGLSKKLIGPWSPSTAFNLIPNPVGSGNALRFTFETNNVAPSIVQNRDICGSKLYRAIFDFRIDQITRTPSGANKTAHALNLQLSLGDCNANRQFLLDDKTFGSWQRMECSFSSNSPALFFTELSQLTAPAGTKWNITIANTKLTALPATLKGKGASAVTNGGFETGAIAPWKGSSKSENSIYEPPYFVADDPCVPGDPKFSVVKPGLPAQGGTAASKHRLRFCGMAPHYYYPYTSEDQFTISQAISKTTLNKAYVLSIQMRAFNITTYRISVAGKDASFSSAITILDRYDRGVSSDLMTFQRIFSGIGEPARFSISFQGFGSFMPYVQVLAFLDNISVRQLDE